MKTSKSQLVEMLATNFLTNSSTAKSKSIELLSNGIATLGYYTGSGKFTKAVSVSLDFLKGLVEFREFNDATKGGVIGKKVEIVNINDNTVNAKYNEFLKSIELSADQKSKKAEERKNSAKAEAEELGFKSVSAMKKAEKEYTEYKNNLMDEAKLNRIVEFERIHGRTYNDSFIKDRVMITTIDLNFNPVSFSEFIKK